MTDLADRIGGAVKTLAGDWAKYAALGSFALYAAGYLALRFHLSVLGLATDLSVLDERYLFAGARFLMYFLSALPSILLVMLPIAAAGWLASRLIPSGVRARGAAFALSPGVLVVSGGLVALLTIQMVMRQCFLLHDLLLAAALPAQPDFIVALLLRPEAMPLYFDALVAVWLFTLACLKGAYGTGSLSARMRTGRSILAVLCAIQFLLLPINFGSLIVDKTLSRVTPATATLTLPGQAAWLVWEGKTGVTFLVCTADTRPCSLLTRPVDKGFPIEVVGADAIFPTLFAENRARRPLPGVERP